VEAWRRLVLFPRFYGCVPFLLNCRPFTRGSAALMTQARPRHILLPPNHASLLILPGEGTPLLYSPLLLGSLFFSLSVRIQIVSPPVRHFPDSPSCPFLEAGGFPSSQSFFVSAFPSQQLSRLLRLPYLTWLPPLQGLLMSSRVWFGSFLF